MTLLDVEVAAVSAPIVSREALAEPPRAKRRYVSGFRTHSKNRTRQALIDQALALIGSGDFRPQVRDITDRAGCHHGAVNYHFGALDLLMRVIAREHWEAVAALLPFAVPDPKAAVWLVLVGRPRPV